MELQSSAAAAWATTFLKVFLFLSRRVFVKQLAIGVAACDAALFGGEFQGFLAVELCLVHQFIHTCGEGLRRVQLCARRPSVRRSKDQGDFAFGGMFFQRLHQSEECAAAEFFVNFRYFARQACWAVAENGERIGERLRDAVRRFIQDDGSVFDAQVFERAAALAGARRKESKKKKLFIWKAGRCECREQCRRAGNRNHRNLVADGQRNQTEAWIRNQRHASITDERDT